MLSLRRPNAEEIAAACITVVAWGFMALPPEIGAPVLALLLIVALAAYWWRNP